MGEILIINLMPNKKETEFHWEALIKKPEFGINITYLYAKTHTSTNIELKYIKAHYSTFDDIKKRKFDGMIVTGAPVELIDFEEVDYWNELQNIFDWATFHVSSSFFICWAAQAALYHYYGIQKYILEEKMFGVFEHQNHFPNFTLMKNIEETFFVPHSRRTEIKIEDVEKIKELLVLASSEKAGVHLITNLAGNRVFATGHAEYPTDRLKIEYLRDLNRGIKIKKPLNYFSGNNSSNPPTNSWKNSAEILFENWVRKISN